MILLLYSIGKNTISNRLKILNNKIEAKKVKFELQNKNEKVVFLQNWHEPNKLLLKYANYEHGTLSSHILH